MTRVEVGRDDGVAHIMSTNETGHLSSDQRTGGRDGRRLGKVAQAHVVKFSAYSSFFSRSVASLQSSRVFSDKSKNCF